MTDTAYMREYFQKHKDTLKIKQKEYNAQNRLAVLKYYSPELCCQICNESHYEFLTIDHANNDGYLHRSNVGGNVYRDIIRGGFPSDFRVLCHNCNLKYRDNSKCGSCGRSISIDTEAAAKNRDRCRTEKFKNQFRKSIIKLKIDVMSHYGGKCKCCGIEDIDALTIEHPNNDGGQHRKEIGVKSGSPFYRWLRMHNYPDGFEVLCLNCNKSRGSYGYCPHEMEKNEN